jgi:hypothetical protein
MIRERPMNHSADRSWFRAAIVPSLLWCSVLAAGCTHLEVVRSTVDGGWQKVPGLTYYGEKPYLLVYPLEGRPGISWQIVYLPDRAETYSISLKGWLGLQSYRVELSEAGTLRSVTAGPAYQAAAPEAPTYLGQQVQAALTAGSSTSSVNPAPGLYEIVFDRDTGTFRGLRLIRFESSLVESPSSQKGPRVREIRFETFPDKPEVVSAILLELDPPVPQPNKGACLPPGLEVSMLRDGTKFEKVCNPPLNCKTSGQEIRCAVGERILHSFLVRALTSGSVEGRPMDAVVEGRFPSLPGGFASFEPSAEIQFGMTSDGKVRTIAVQYDRRGGSCINPDDPGTRAVLREGHNISELWLPQKSDKCLLGSTLTLAVPARDIFVSVIPKNAGGLSGKMVFASASAPSAAAENRTLNLNVSASGATQSTLTVTPSTGEPKLPVPPVGKPQGHTSSWPRKQSEELPTRLIETEGHLTNSQFSSFTVRFAASIEAARGYIKASGWWMPVNSQKDNAEKEVILPISREDIGEKKVIVPIDGTTCAKQGVSANWKKFESIRYTPPKAYKGKDFETLLFNLSSPSAGARRMCFELQFQRPAKGRNASGEPEPHVITVDESLLAAPDASP